MIGEELNINQETDWITIVLVLSIFLIVLAKHLFQNRFLNFIILPFNNKYVALYNKKDKMMHGFHILFTVFQLLNTSLYIYLIYKILYGDEEAGGLVFYGLILGFLVLFVIVKMLLQFANGFVFNNVRTITELIYRKHTYLNYSGLVMLSANIIMVYILKDSRPFVFLSLAIVLLINCIGLITLLKNNQKTISGYFFYFILYLCALEIAPLLFIANYLKY